MRKVVIADSSCDDVSVEEDRIQELLRDLVVDPHEAASCNDVVAAPSFER